MDGVGSGGRSFFFRFFLFLGESKSRVFFFLEGFFYNFDPSLDDSFDVLSGDLTFFSTFFSIVKDSFPITVSKGIYSNMSKSDFLDKALSVSNYTSASASNFFLNGILSIDYTGGDSAFLGES